MLTVSYTSHELVSGGMMLNSQDAMGTLLPGYQQNAATNATGTFTVQLEKSPALLANAAASAAFDMAAQYVESLFYDPVTVVIDADVSVLSPGVIGSTGSTRVPISYGALRTLMVDDAQEDEVLPALLPTANQLTTIFPTDAANPFVLSGAVANRATLKALGVAESSLSGPASQYNPSVIQDMSISFSGAVNFDYNPQDGISPGQVDFVGVAVHEIMHGLGFVSAVNSVDFYMDVSSGLRQIPISPLDLYRLRPGAGITDFTNAPRVMTPEGNAVTYDGVYSPFGFNIPGLTVGDVPMSTGTYNGDGRQASHWKSDDVTGVTIGIMDPTIGNGQLGVVTDADLRALGLIGWDITQPLQVSVAGVSHLEGDVGTTNFVFTVTASTAPSEPFTVQYGTVGQTATAGSDFTPVSGTLTFTPDGPLTQNVTVRVFGDLTVEQNETFVLRLSNASSPASIGTADGIGLILNDDVEVSVGDATIVEGHDGTRDAVFAITAFGSVNQNISVSYSTLNQSADGAADYLPRAGSVLLTPNAPIAFVSVPIVGDHLDEGDETFLVVVTDTQGARVGDGVGVGTIVDDDPMPAFYVNDVRVTTTEAGTFAAVFTVALDAPSGRNVTVNFATANQSAVAGLDYQSLVGALTFAPGMRTRTVAVPISTGAVYSPDKKFLLSLSSPQNALLGDASGVGTIVFADAPVGERIIDNGDAGYSRTNNGWTSLTNTLAYGLDYDYHAAGSGTGSASYTFNGLAPGSYEIYTKWTAFSNRASNAPYTILNGSTSLGTVLVDQRNAPAGDVSNGVVWQKLGTYQVTSGTLVVRLGDNANGYVIADAVRIVTGGIAPQVPEINVASSAQSIAAGDTTPTTFDGTDFGSVSMNKDSIPHTFTISNVGNAVLHLGGTPRVSISGANTSDFIITTQPAATLNPNASTNFVILFRPTGTGLRQATITIANDDSDEGPYSFVIQGTGTAALSEFAHNDTLPQDVNADNRVSTTDVMLLVNRLLSQRTAQPLASPMAATGGSASSNYYVDVNADGRLSVTDVMLVINYMLRNQNPTATPAAAPAVEPLAATAVDSALILFDDMATPISSETGPRLESSLEEESGQTSGPGQSTPLAAQNVAAALAFSGLENDEMSTEADETWDLLSLEV